MFVTLYDLEIIEEDAFISWKEDVNDQHPGKGQALFQVCFPHLKTTQRRKDVLYSVDQLFRVVLKEPRFGQFGVVFGSLK